MVSKKSKKDAIYLQYTFRWQHFSGLIKHGLEYVLISYDFQEVVENSEILGTMSTNHSALFSSI